MELGLGRLVAEDERDKKFLMASLLGEPSTRTKRYWNANGWWGDQGSEPSCVGFSLVHLLEDGPVTHPGVRPVLNPSQVYREAQLIDEWPGEDYAGTSIRAGMQVLRRAGYIKEFRWAWDLDTVVNTLRDEGPVEMGTWWYYDMFFPNSRGVIKIGGNRVGGHAYKLDGVNFKTRMVRAKNSWGRAWGNKGFFWMSFDDLARLISEDGEAAIPLEVRLQPNKTNGASMAKPTKFKINSVRVEKNNLGGVEQVAVAMTLKEGDVAHVVWMNSEELANYKAATTDGARHAVIKSTSLRGAKDKVAAIEWEEANKAPDPVITPADQLPPDLNTDIDLV